MKTSTYRKPRLVFRLLTLVMAATASFFFSRSAFAVTAYINLGTVTPHTSITGNPPSLMAHWYLDEATSYSFRYVETLDTDIVWDTTRANEVNGSSDYFGMAFHVFNYNSNCYRGNVTEAHDSYGYRYPGSWWGTDLPNASQEGDFKKNAKCSGQSSSWELNEVRFIVRDSSHTNYITVGQHYRAYATFVDLNYPGARAWLEGNYNFIHEWWWWGHDDIYYEGAYGNKTCLNGYNQVFRGWTCP